MNAKAIKTKLDARGMKYSWFAEQMKVSKTLVSFWFSGERQMTSAQKTKADTIFERANFERSIF